MCRVLELPRSSYYYKETTKGSGAEIETTVLDEFRNSRNNYGTRKLKIVLNRRGIKISRRRIGNIMKKYGLVCFY